MQRSRIAKNSLEKKKKGGAKKPKSLTYQLPKLIIKL